jgi:DNA-binding MarR family transcriptional regulator
MPATLRDDLRQTKPFSSLREEALLNVIRTAARLTDGFEDLLRPHGISGPQYNVLRILRGARPGGLCRNDVRDRMITRMPDMTRLLDRMEEAGLVSRAREGEDRRMVLTRITDAGLRLVDELDGPITALHQAQIGHLSEEQLRTLIEMLTLTREGA